MGTLMMKVCSVFTLCGVCVCVYHCVVCVCVCVPLCGVCVCHCGVCVYHCGVCVSLCGVCVSLCVCVYHFVELQLQVLLLDVDSSVGTEGLVDVLGALGGGGVRPEQLNT